MQCTFLATLVIYGISAKALEGGQLNYSFYSFSYYRNCWLQKSRQQRTDDARGAALHPATSVEPWLRTHAISCQHSPCPATSFNVCPPVSSPWSAIILERLYCHLSSLLSACNHQRSLITKTPKDNIVSPPCAFDKLAY